MGWLWWRGAPGWQRWWLGIEWPCGGLGLARALALYSHESCQAAGCRPGGRTACCGRLFVWFSPCHPAGSRFGTRPRLSSDGYCHPAGSRPGSRDPFVGRQKDPKTSLNVHQCVRLQSPSTRCVHLLAALPRKAAPSVHGRRNRGARSTLDDRAKHKAAAKASPAHPAQPSPAQPSPAQPSPSPSPSPQPRPGRCAVRRERLRSCRRASSSQSAPWSWSRRACTDGAVFRASAASR
jgi:hypothetical protein